MARQQQWLELQQFDKALEVTAAAPLLWVHRPIYLHAANETGKPCPCCDSPFAIKTREIDHLDLLVHRYHGTRRLRGEVVSPAGERRDRTPAEIEQWDELAYSDVTEVVEMPMRVYEQQLPLVLDHYHKVVYVSGGQGSGKTTIAGEWCVDSWILYGGRGVEAGWISATRDLAYVGVVKLFVGEHSGNRFQQPLFDERLVRSYPKTPDAIARRPCVLIDGTRIHVRHAGKKSGGSLKARGFRWVNVEEIAEIVHPNNWETTLGRTGRTGGTVFISSTPRGGHWSKEIYDRGKRLSFYDKNPDEDGAERYVSEELSALSNVFIDREEVKRTIAGRENDPNVRREWLGEWIGDGVQLWRHFSAKPKDVKRKGRIYQVQHLRTGPWRDVTGWGLENVTSLAYVGHFKKSSADLSIILGQDVNKYPQHTAVIQIACPPGMQADRSKWILFVLDEAVRPGTELEHADYLVNRYVRERGIDLSNRAMIIDATACRRQNSYIQKRLKGSASTSAQVFRMHGLDARPPVPGHFKDREREGYNPHREDAASMIHHLMESVFEWNGQLWPRLVIHADRCPNIVEAFRIMERDQLRRKDAQSDRLCGAVQSVYYPAWPVFGNEVIGHQKRKRPKKLRGMQFEKSS